MNHSLTRDVNATIIPAGDAVTLTAGSTVQVTQDLGGNVTVRFEGGLARIDQSDADALAGYEGVTIAESEHRGEFSEDAVWTAMKTCFDPEIPVNIVDLGLIYDLSIEAAPGGGNDIEVKMTLTAPGCGMGPVIAEDARKKIEQLPEVNSAKVHIVWDPVWNPQMISGEGRKVLGLE